MLSCRMQQQAHLAQSTPQHSANPQQQHRRPGLWLTKSPWCLQWSWCSQQGCCCCCSCSCTAAVRRRGCTGGAARGATTCSGCREEAASQTIGKSCWNPFAMTGESCWNPIGAQHWSLLIFMQRVPQSFVLMRGGMLTFGLLSAVTSRLLTVLLS